MTAPPRTHVMPTSDGASVLDLEQFAQAARDDGATDATKVAVQVDAAGLVTQISCPAR